MFPIGTDRPLRRTPWVNIAIIAANVFIYFVTHGSSHGAGGGGGSGDLLPQAQKYMLGGPPGVSVSQFLTYQFLHQNLMHLVGNMVFLYVFGNNLNEKLGHIGYLLCYLTGGVLAGCGQVLTSHAPTLGASGSISAITGLFFVLLPRTNIRLFIWFYFYVDVFEIPAMWFIGFSVAKDFLEAQFVRDSGVAHYAHLAGSASGILIGVLLLGAKLIQRDHYDFLALADRWRRRRQYESLVRQGYDPFQRGVPPPASARLMPQVVTDPRISELRDSIAALIHAHQIPAAAARYLELHSLDSTQVLAAQDQLDIANQLMSESHYDFAAQAYEDYLRLYRDGTQGDQVMLILGLIYARYLPKPQRAAELLRDVSPRLHDLSQRLLAEEELKRLIPPAIPPTPPDAPPSPSAPPSAP